MNLLIQHGRVIDPASGFDQHCDIALDAGRIVALGQAPADFVPRRVLDARGCIVLPGLVDLAARLREPGHEHEGMLESELAAAVAGGVTSLVCLPDTEPVLDEPGLVEMLKSRAEKLHLARVFPLGALTRGLAGEVLTEMAELAEAGCIGFGQAEVPLPNTQVLQRALQYAATFGYTVWLRPQDAHLGRGVAASGPLATRLGLAGVPVAAETIALHTIFELQRSTGARVHLCRLSSAAGVELVRRAKAEGLPLSCDVSINSLHLTDTDMGYFDSRARLAPPLRQARDRDALRAGLADGTIDALVSDHTPVDEDAKAQPFAEAEPGATGLELLLSLALKWSQEQGVPLARAFAVVSSAPAGVLGNAPGACRTLGVDSENAPQRGQFLPDSPPHSGTMGQEDGKKWAAAAHSQPTVPKSDRLPGTLQASLGRIVEGGVADLCIFDPQARWSVRADALRSQGKHTPFLGYELPGQVRWTLVGGAVAFERV